MRVKIFYMIKICIDSLLLRSRKPLTLSRNNISATVFLSSFIVFDKSSTPCIMLWTDLWRFYPHVLESNPGLKISISQFLSTGNIEKSKIQTHCFLALLWNRSSTWLKFQQITLKKSFIAWLKFPQITLKKKSFLPSRFPWDKGRQVSRSGIALLMKVVSKDNTSK